MNNIITEKQQTAFETVNIGRRDYYWILSKDSQKNIKQKLTPQLIHSHIQGQTTLGMSPFIDLENVLYIGVDIDCHVESGDSEEIIKEKQQHARDNLKKYTDWLTENDYLFYVNSSGSPIGWHIKIYSDRPINAEIGCAWIKYVSKELLHIESRPEIFPKQHKLDEIIPTDTYEDRQKKTCYGNQMKLVLGMHPKHQKQAVVLKSDGSHMTIAESLDFFVEFADKIKTAKKIEFEITEEIRAKYISKKYTPEEIKVLQDKPIPKKCFFFENVALNHVLPSTSEINRHTALDPNFYVLCMANNQQDKLKLYMSVQGRTQDAFNNSQNWFWNCKRVQDYIVAQKDVFTDEIKTLCENICENCPYNTSDAPIWTVNSKGIRTLILKSLFLKVFQKTNFITIGEDRHKIYFYKDGMYMAGGENKIAELCENITSGCVGQHQILEVANQIKRNSFKLREDVFEPKNLDLICVQNGILNIKTREIQPHTPDQIFTQKIPLTYNPDKKAHKIIEYIKSTLDRRDIKCFQEFLGYMLYRKYLIKKSVIFVGEKDTGKTKLLMLILKFIGDKNTSGVSLHVLAANLFSASQLEHKLLNFFDDLSLRDLSDTSAFKIACGGGKMSAERKFGETFEFYNYAKLLFATNKFAGVKDIDDMAYYGRWMIFFFNNVFTVKTANPTILEDVTTPDELSGLLNWALDGLDRLLKNRDFSYDRTAEENKQVMLCNVDTVYNFVETCLTEKIGLWISKQDLYTHYLDNCRENNSAPVTMVKFGTDLSVKCKFIRDGKKQIEKKRHTGWLNVVYNPNKDKQETPLDETKFKPGASETVISALSKLRESKEEIRTTDLDLSVEDVAYIVETYPLEFCESTAGYLRVI